MSPPPPVSAASVVLAVVADRGSPGGDDIGRSPATEPSGTRCAEDGFGNVYIVTWATVAAFAAVSVVEVVVV